MMGNPLFGIVEAQALAVGSDEAGEALAMRRRIAIISYALGLGAIILIAGWMNSVVALVVGLVTLLIVLFVFAEWGDGVAALVRSKL